MTMSMIGPWGRIEGLLDMPASEPKAAVVLVGPRPGEGTMRSRVAFEAARGFRRVGAATLRFNFAGVGLTSAPPDGPSGERACSIALNELAARFPGRPLWTAGYGFGAGVAATAARSDERVTAWLGIAPLAGEFTFESVLPERAAKFIIHGELDERITLKTVHRLYAQFNEPRELIVIDGANHTFDGRASQVADAVADLYGDLDA